ncbi:MAG TPA: MG2 domain-containing protein [Candidatus Elarobacter sp.]|jgi:hypothetical protein|nr:MG2 domain-containing protein [Candidatus Elarobacter sp.]
MKVRRLLVMAVLLVAAATVPAGSQIGVYYANFPAYTPDAPVTLSLAAPSLAAVEVEVFRLPADDMVALRRGTPRLDVEQRIAEQKLRPVKVVRAQLAVPSPSPSPGPAPRFVMNAVGTADLGTFSPGLYVARTSGGSLETRLALFTVTSFGTVMTETGDRMLAYAIDFRTKRRRADVSFERRTAAGAVDAGTPDASGAVSFPVHTGEDGDRSDLFVAHAPDGSTVVTYGAPSYEHGPQRSAFVHTDRPIYRPGDVVHYRAILRDGVPGAYTVPTGDLTVRVKDANGKAIVETKRPIDAFGTIQGTVTLADDAALGVYSIDGGENAYDVFGSFAVEAYKKPEYLVDVAAPRNAVGGEGARFGVAARYFFGRPVAGMKLHYRASARSAYAWWRRGAPFSFSGYRPSWYGQPGRQIEGDAVADAAGRATITIPTAPVTDEELLTVEIDGRDTAGRTVTASASTELTPAAFYLTVEPERYFNRVGEEVGVALRSLVYANAAPRPRTPVSVSFTRVWYDRGGVQREIDSSGARQIVTDEHGAASVRWKPSQGGYYEIAASATDERGRTAKTFASVWISSSSYANRYTFTTTTVVPQQREYRPGEPAILLVTAPQGNVDAVVHVTGGGRDRVFLRHLDSVTSTIQIDPPPGVPRYLVTVGVPTANGLETGSAIVTVSPAPHTLRIAIRGDKARYSPGERARFSIHAEGLDGKPARAEIGLAVVDDAIFALRRDAATDPYRALYAGTGPNRNVQVSWSQLNAPISVYFLPRLQMIGRTQARSTTDMFSISGAQAAPPPSLSAPALGAPSFDKLRSDFRDTAYWSPSVITGADGNAIVTFTWPDSLTSYTAAGIGVTQQTDVGRGIGTALVTKDFLVRLAAPRFLRHGDTATMTATAQGTPRAKSALLRFSAPELGIADATTPARFDAHASANARWKVRGGDLGDASLRLAGTSGALSDGLRMKIPVESSANAVHDRSAGALPLSSTATLALPRGSEAGDLRIDLAPSALAQLAAGVRLLEIYPYYCVEQTMSAALPAIYVDRMRKRMRLPAGEGPAPEKVAKKAVDRLVKLQHADGSWGWWEHDEANPFMTAYALYGLAELARDGYPVPPSAIDAGAKSVVSQLAQRGDTLAFWGGPQPNSEWNTRAYMLFALANARPQSVDRELLKSADAQAKVLNTYALSALGLAHIALGDKDGAQPLLAELLRRVADDGTYAQWKGAGWHYRWEDDPIETTAYGLRFLNAMTPNDPRVGHAVNWLRVRQHGSWFETTKDTAAAIYAMSEAIPQSADELNPHETVRVTVGGRVVKSVRIDTPVLTGADASIRIPAKLLRNGGTVRFAREGTGGLWWSTDWTRYVAQPPGALLDPAFAIARTYTSQNGNDWRVGDQVDVDVTVTPSEDAQYVAIVDPLPAGLEYQPRQYESGDDWSGLQFFDDRVVFFATLMSSGRPVHLHYTLRATTPGAFTAPATTVFAMYGPPVNALGTPARIVIR